jgi:hypothetical protein
MGTSAVIRVENVEYAEVYKHWDGYPEGTLAWLEKFNKEFTENRGVDNPYKFAQLLRNSVVAQEEFNLDPSETTGWGVEAYGSVHGDFTYTLKEDGTVVVEGDE